jgi:hypothetical protein
MRAPNRLRPSRGELRYHKQQEEPSPAAHPPADVESLLPLLPHCGVAAQDGQVKHLEIPDNETFDIDGKQLKVSELKPGTRLMKVVTTTTQDVTVGSIRTVDLKVIQVIPPDLNLQYADGTQKLLRVPEGTTFDIDGKTMKLTDLREGMRVKGTVVTKTPKTVVSESKTVSGVAPIEIPTVVGVLLIDEKR